MARARQQCQGQGNQNDFEAVRETTKGTLKRTRPLLLAEQLSARLLALSVPATKRTQQPMRTANPIDVAARYLVYKLYEVTDGRPAQWQKLRALGELPATIVRAVERGWVALDSARS